MAHKKRPRYKDLDPDERRQVIRGAKYAIKLDKAHEKRKNDPPKFNLMSIVSGGYEDDRRLWGRRSQFGDEPGYNHLHGQDFEQIVCELQQDFPGEVIKILDVGCGQRNFLQDLEFSFNTQNKREIDCLGTNIRKISTRGSTKVMLAENLKLSDDEFHLVVTTSAATKYTRNLPLVLDEMYRVVKPGGRVYFQGLPGEVDANRSDFEIDFHDFQVAHSLHIHDNKDAWMQDAHWFRKPRK